MATTAATKISAEEAHGCVEHLRQRACQLFQERVVKHRFTQELCEGSLPKEKFIGFLKNWYTFAVEINTTKAAMVDRYLPFLKRHSECYDLLTEHVADEFSHPGRGGHVKMFIPVAEAFGLQTKDLVEHKLIPEARALVDVRCQLLQKGPMAEAWAASLSEGPLGEWLGLIGRALEKHYGLTPEQAIYFSEHYKADTQEHEEGIMAHGMFNAYLLLKLLEDGYRPERPGFDLDYSVELSIDLYRLFLDGVYARD
jgi:pyrroloquinoline quinone (PQQ) biosynthesis protein C